MLLQKCNWPHLPCFVQAHCVGRDLLLMGRKGSGKSHTAKLFANALGYAPVQVSRLCGGCPCAASATTLHRTTLNFYYKCSAITMLLSNCMNLILIHRFWGVVQTLFVYQDMTARDLLQRRSTDEFGATTWSPTPLALAVRTGQLAVLDGLQVRVRAAHSLPRRGGASLSLDPLPPHHTQ